MPENLYCDPCRRFLCGDVFIIFFNRYMYEFDHHVDFESFENAMRLPCAICTIAYPYIETPPTLLSWMKTKLLVRRPPDSLGLSSLMSSIQSNDKSLEIDTWLRLQENDGELNPQIASGLSLNTGSKSAIDFLLEKYRDCRENHQGCDLPRSLGSVAYPSRLLDVKTGDDSLVTLRDTGKMRHEEYICLSHCWGYVRPFTLEAKTLSALTTGIKVNALPKTFQNAIAVTRYLQIGYIWIDSLCILQDSEIDWAAGSSIMGSIYAGAACTIAATAARDSNEGLFFDRRPQNILPRFIDFDCIPNIPGTDSEGAKLALVGSYLCDRLWIAKECIEGAPLNRRAWVSQERQLSRRVVHFTTKQLFWECDECEACEVYPRITPEWARGDWKSNATELKGALSMMTVHKDACELPRFPSIIPPKRLDDYIYRAWSIYRFQYTKCNLTYSTDKLVAIQGIATWVSQVTGDEFVAGLWRSRIIEELCWYRDIPGAESSPWRAPSWSWASCDEGIRMCVTAHLHMQCATRQIEAELVDLNVNAKTSGQLEAASMRIKCKLLYALLIPQSSAEWPGDPRHDSLELFSSEGDPTNSNLSSRLANLDVFSYIDIDDGRIPEPEYGYVSVIQYCAHASTSEIPEVTEDSDEQEDDGKYPGGRFEALFLKPCDEASQAFKRVGIISPMTARTLRLVLKAHHMAEERVIILV